MIQIVLLFIVVVKFKCEYNGKNFSGFQKQGAKRTVQSVLEEAITRYLRTQVKSSKATPVTNEISLAQANQSATKNIFTPIKLSASGRTDSGVHARAQVCSFIYDETQYGNLRAKTRTQNSAPILDLFRLTAAVNAFLPPDVSVRDFEFAPDTFHAQFSAKIKTYLYRVYVNRFRSPVRDDFYRQVHKMPDIFLMRKCANELVGKHNFKSFTSEDTDSHGFVREIFSFNIEQRGGGAGAGADELWFWVRGGGFMRNMVRIMIGTLLDIGMGKRRPDLIAQLLSTPDRTQAGETAPANALMLYDVEY